MDKIYRRNCNYCKDYYEGYGKYFCSFVCRCKMGRKTIDQLFWSKVKKTRGCWIWNGGINKDGYGKVMFLKKTWTTHRLSWKLHHGEIPRGMCVCHKCDNPSCVNPKHLFLGTNKDNTQDMISKNRDIMKGEKNGNSKLTKEHVLKIRKLYSKGNYTYHKLSIMFNVSITNISDIIRKKIWKHLINKKYGGRNFI